jgi:hypothetical protein
MYSVLNCFNVARDTEFCWVSYNSVTSSDKAWCFKNSFTLAFQMLLCETSVMKTFALKSIQTIHH